MIVVPSVKPPRGPGRGQNKQLLYSFRDVVAARTATELRKCGISLQALRRAVAQLKRQKHAINPRAEDRLVVAPDGDVLGIQPPDKALSLMERPAELIFYNLNYGELVQQLRAEAEAMLENDEDKKVKQKAS